MNRKDTLSSQRPLGRHPGTQYTKTTHRHTCSLVKSKARAHTSGLKATSMQNTYKGVTLTYSYIIESFTACLKVPCISGVSYLFLTQLAEMLTISHLGPNCISITVSCCLNMCPGPVLPKPSFHVLGL